MSGEDYRWKVIQDGVHPVLFQIFNFVFIAFIQNILLGSLLSPVYAAWAASYDASGRMMAPLGALDAFATALGLSFIIMEAVADQQQWEFHNAKRAAIASGKRMTGPVARGFLEDGLFKYSRHPNFFAEQAFWWTLCLFATAATGRWVGWWLGGAIALTALFQGSTWLTEKISSQKYPKYEEYKKYTSRLMPWFPGQRPPKRIRRRSSASPYGRVAAEAIEDYHTPGGVLTEGDEDEFPDIPLAGAAAVEEEAPKRRGRPSTRRQSSAKKPAGASRSRSVKRAAPVAPVSEPEEAVVEEEEEVKPAPSRRPRSLSATKAAASGSAKKPVRPRGRSRSTGGEKAAAAVAEKAASTAAAPRGRSASTKGRKSTAPAAEKKVKAPAAAKPRGRPAKVTADPVAEPAPRRATRARRD